jgi:predicted nucleotidyltransferase
MLSLEFIKNTLIENKQRLYSRYGLINIAVFGSYARNQQTEDFQVIGQSFRISV